MVAKHKTSEDTIKEQIKQVSKLYCHFVIFRQNVDPYDIVTTLCRKLHFQRHDFSLPTKLNYQNSTMVQKVSVRFKPSDSRDRLLQLNNEVQNFKIGNCILKKHGRSGSLIGNHFEVVIRNVSNPYDYFIEEVSEHWAKTGFINYFGFDYYGSGKVNLGKFMLHCADTTLQMKLPNRERQFHLKAYQAVTWNKFASYRIKQYGLQPIIGDLVLTKGKDSTGISIVKSITAEDINQKQYTVEQVVLPYPGHGLKYPENLCLNYMSNILQQDGIELINIPRRRGDMSLICGYRPIISKPQNVEWDLVSYDDPTLPLIENDYEHLFRLAAHNFKYRQMKIKYEEAVRKKTLNGASEAMSKPDNEESGTSGLECKETEESDEDLAKGIDVDELYQGIGLESEEQPSSSDGLPEKPPSFEFRPQLGVENGLYKALRLRFMLSQEAFGTSALREIMSTCPPYDPVNVSQPPIQSCTAQTSLQNPIAPLLQVSTAQPLPENPQPPLQNYTAPPLLINPTSTTPLRNPTAPLIVKNAVTQPMQQSLTVLPLLQNPTAKPLLINPAAQPLVRPLVRILTAPPVLPTPRLLHNPTVQLVQPLQKSHNILPLQQIPTPPPNLLNPIQILVAQPPPQNAPAPTLLLNPTAQPTLPNPIAPPPLRNHIAPPSLLNPTPPPSLQNTTPLPPLQSSTIQPLMDISTTQPPLRNPTSQPSLRNFNRPTLSQNPNRPLFLRNPIRPPLLTNPNGPPLLPNPNGPPLLPNPNGPPLLPNPNGPPLLPNPNRPPLLLNPNGPALLPNPNGPPLLPIPNGPPLLPIPNGPPLLPNPNGPPLLPNPNGPQPQNLPIPDERIYLQDRFSDELVAPIGFSQPSSNPPSLMEIEIKDHFYK
ncbi:tyrosine-protein phosphatase non-receptor type 23-like isoform X2 [Clytia hemisphaerica]